MSHTSEHLLVLTAMPDAKSAKALALAVIEHKLAACVNLLPKMRSFYRWQGKIQQGEEHQLLIKTHENSYVKLQEFIASEHPYELAEIIAVPIIQGLPDYLSWITDNCDVC